MCMLLLSIAETSNGRFHRMDELDTMLTLAGHISLFLCGRLLGWGDFQLSLWHCISETVQDRA